MKNFNLFDLENEPEQSGQQKIKNKSDTPRIYNPVAAQKETEAQQREAWAAYQEAIVKSGELTSEITKGIQAGEKPEVLLLKAIECISLITGNKLFYELNRENIKKIYG